MAPANTLTTLEEPAGEQGYMMSSPTYVSKSFMLRLRIIARQFVQFSRQRVVLWQPRDRGMHGEYADFYNLLPTPPCECVCRRHGRSPPCILLPQWALQGL
jgi:hypothetical protein